jgi:hypothetical protein
MVEKLLRSPAAVSRWESGLFAPYLDSYAGALRERGLQDAVVLYGSAL